jgi:hypothetical protein
MRATTRWIGRKPIRDLPVSTRRSFITEGCRNQNLLDMTAVTPRPIRPALLPAQYDLRRHRQTRAFRCHQKKPMPTLFSPSRLLLAEVVAGLVSSLIESFAPYPKVAPRGALLPHDFSTSVQRATVDIADFQHFTAKSPWVQTKAMK